MGQRKPEHTIVRRLIPGDQAHPDNILRAIEEALNQPKPSGCRVVVVVQYCNCICHITPRLSTQERRKRLLVARQH